ncbi:hypothetical protein [Halochromatium roseum]|uniref:hypothetical protein n=1 Tax=Halochromatium roseum TaxID=391920 RepID=UPI0019140E44|nr:hypothetical protein [Halochromatium roseum]MBK5938241.1 hypothetical protein [Halochromatium roseum]
MPMTVIEFCYTSIEGFNDEQFLEISDGYKDSKTFFSQIPWNKKLLALYPGDADALYTHFKAFYKNYINELYQYTHGRDLIVDDDDDTPHLTKTH